MKAISKCWTTYMNDDFFVAVWNTVVLLWFHLRTDKPVTVLIVFYVFFE